MDHHATTIRRMLDDDNSLNPDIADGVLLRQQHFMGKDEVGKQLVKEAYDVYYGENHFNMRLHWLRGLLDGSDLATHQMIKDIFYVAKLLIQKFGDKFAIRKMISRGDGYGGSYLSHSLRSYWDPPTETARQKVRQGEATFEQVMQIEIEEWTHVFPRTIGPWMGREILV
ncbi:hypothetical protein DER46DRAFT_688861 [Fusarium sp. MPI-SDFR-AT-0072]|nr:hypothetical protein DER46DRAFT_688861 [Fusarium sp. MPI-SDFR-AT-0072]